MVQRRPQRRCNVAKSLATFDRRQYHHHRFFATTASSSSPNNNNTLAVDEYRIATSDDNDDDIATTIKDELAMILQPYYKEQRPVVVRGAVQTVPATTLWTNWDYWKQAVAKWDENNDDDDDGDDTTMVAVELGGSYGSEQSERAEIPFLAYLQYLELFEERHGRTGNVDRNDPKFSKEPPLSSWSIPSSELVYMAQNDLPHPLYKDIFIPDFCQSSNHIEDAEAEEEKPISGTASLGLGRLYSVMLWLGPRGCVSPLHFDPLDNCLMQHMGRKRVLLYEPSAAEAAKMGWHYAGHDGQQSNTSPINPEVMDVNDTDRTKLLQQQQQEVRSKYPLFLEEAPKRMECFLDAGDLLYIPAKWWHHVRSIDTSASVNVWWR